MNIIFLAKPEKLKLIQPWATLKVGDEK